MTTFDNVRKTGFHVDLIERAVRSLNGGELPEYDLVNLETSFDDDSVFRHMDYIGLGEDKLVGLHLDEMASGIRWVGQVVLFRDLGPIEVAQVSIDPEGPGGADDGLTNGLVVNLSFGSHATLDLEQTLCDDPDCTYDHGYSGFLKREGLSMRFEDEPSQENRSSSDEALDFVRRITAAMSDHHQQARW